MTNEEVKEVYARAEMEYDMLKDRVHDLYDKNVELQQENEKLKNILVELENFIIRKVKDNTKLLKNGFIKEDDRVKLYTENFIYQDILDKIKGDKEND